MSPGVRLDRRRQQVVTMACLAEMESLLHHRPGPRASTATRSDWQSEWDRVMAKLRGATRGQR